MFRGKILPQYFHIDKITRTLEFLIYLIFSKSLVHEGKTNGMGIFLVARD